MDLDQIIDILKVRQSVASETGNSTELALVCAVIKIAEELKELKSKTDN